jgi:tetratricopeptide (TPR) repeat protein
VIRDKRQQDAPANGRQQQGKNQKSKKTTGGNELLHDAHSIAPRTHAINPKILITAPLSRIDLPHPPNSVSAFFKNHLATTDCIRLLMAKIPLSNLDPREQKQAASAEQALRTSPQYSVEVFQGIVSRNPECLEARRLLRRAQKVQRGVMPSNKGLGGLFSGFSGIFGNNKLVEADPRHAMEQAEKNLAKKPNDIAANRLLAAAAEKLAWHDTAAFAYEEIAQADPKNVTHFVNWGSALIKAEDYDGALNATDEALKRFPGNGELQEIARRASVAKTVQKGRWEADDDFKSKVKDLDAASQLDKSNRVVQDIEEATRIVAELEQKIAADPENVDLYREAVRNYTIIGDLGKAIETLSRARQTNIGRADAALEKQENELSILALARKVEALEKQLEQDPENTQLRAQYEQERTAEFNYRLKISQNLVERYPNDYGYRYNLGVLLLEARRVDEAIQQLQIAQRNPKNRHSAMLNLARAFICGHKYDLAVDQLQTAKGEILPMSDIKKEIIYELGSALEKSKRGKDAIDEYKILYMADSSYKDVAQKINTFYESQK